jgi:hypothetical protein
MGYSYLKFKDDINYIINMYISYSISLHKKESIIKFISKSINSYRFDKVITTCRRIEFLLTSLLSHSKYLIIYKKTKIFNLLFAYEIRKLSKKYDVVFVIIHHRNIALFKIFKELINKNPKLLCANITFRFIDKEVKK